MRVAMWFSASIAIALASHAAIDLLASASGGHAHNEYAHVAVIPLLLVASALASTVVAWSAIRRIARVNGVDPVLTLAGRFEAANPMRSSIAAIVGGLGILIAMESAEQFVALGYVQGVGDALGGNAPFGLGVVVAIGSLATMLALRCARAVAATAEATIEFAISWFSRAPRIDSECPAIVRFRFARKQIHACAFFTRSLGLRAPPASLR